jgi:putative ABC transport system substrate-binding protein
MQDQGYVEGRDFDLVQRFAEGAVGRLPTIMEEMVQLKPDVILAPATLEAVAAKRATSTIPIVCPALADALNLGLIASEARPGGNLTGIEPYIEGLPAKQIELACEIVPNARKIGLLTNREDPKGTLATRDLEAAGRALAADRYRKCQSAGRDRGRVANAGRRKGRCGNRTQTNLLVLNSPRIAASALEKQLPTVYGYREHVVTGGLVSYGADTRWCFRRAAYFVAKILRAAAPGDLPIEFPTSFWLAVNLKTAKALSVTIPPSLLARADEVIE